MRNKIIVLAVMLAGVGLLDTSYLTTLHLTGGSPRCLTTQDCDVVLRSVYAEWYGIPTAAFGLAFYAAMFALLMTYKSGMNRKLLTYALGLSFVAVLASSGFVYIQAFVLEAFCTYCLISAGISTLLLILTVLLTRFAQNDIKADNYKK